MLRNLLRLASRDRWLLVSAAVLGIVVCALAAWVGRGTFIHYVYAFGVGLYLAAPALLVALGMVVYVMVLGRREVLRIHGFFGGALGVAFVAAMLPLSYFAGLIFLGLDVRRAKVCCEYLVPRLEEWCATNGDYPDRIELVEPNSRERPRLPRDRSFYSASEEPRYFYFEVSDPSQLGFAGHVYSSNGDDWGYYRD